MRETNRAVSSVDALSAMTSSAHDINPKILRPYDYIGFLGLGKNSNGNSGCMNPTRAFRLRNPLNPMRTAFVPQSGIHILSGKRKYHFLESLQKSLIGIHDLQFPSFSFREPAIHPEKITGKQRGLLTACSSSDLHDDVLSIKRIGWNDKKATSIRDLLYFSVDLGKLKLGHAGYLLIAIVRKQICALTILDKLLKMSDLLYDRLQMRTLKHELLVSLRFGRYVKRLQARSVLSQAPFKILKQLNHPTYTPPC